MQIISSPNPDEKLTDWLSGGLGHVQSGLAETGAVLLRGFDTSDAAVLRQALAALGHEPMEDARWSSPRSSVGEGAFTSTDYPADQTIVLHSEMAYARAWPRFLLFKCSIAAETGGATTICDLAAFSEEIADIVEEFHEREVLYIRNFRPGVDIPWQNAFGTDDREKVEEIGAENGIEIEWQDNGVLRTYQQAQGAVDGDRGPQWFNQGHLYHASQLAPDTRRALMAAFGEEGMPRNAVFGDGEPIPDATVARVLEAMTRCTQNIDWRAGDLAILDNMRWMHGRAPYTGARKVHVAMGRRHTDRAVTPLF